MSEAEKILSEIYKEANYGVIVYKTNGEIIWKNEIAAKIASRAAKLEQNVYTEIKSGVKRSGRIKTGSGGRYRYAKICAAEVLIAELYAESRLPALFEDETVSEFVKESDTAVREAVTGISAACETLESIGFGGDDEAAKACFDSIISGCFRMMKSTAVILLLSSAAGESTPELMLTDINMFLEKFAENCYVVLGGRIITETDAAVGAAVRTDKLQLTYLLLLIVRSCLEKSEVSSELKIACSSSENTVFIEIGAAGAEKEITSKSSGYNEKVTKEIIQVLAEKLGARIEYMGAKVTVELKREKDYDELLLETDKIFFSDSMFSPHRIMLYDLSESESIQ